MIIFYIKSFLFSLLWLSLIASNNYMSLGDGHIDAHLAQFTNLNVHHHDNIDDESHSHRHKHSDEGEEHEHHHDHSKVSQAEIKLIRHDMHMITKVSLLDSKHNFMLKNLISNPHPSKIYRPPIAI